MAPDPVPPPAEQTSPAAPAHRARRPPSERRSRLSRVEELLLDAHPVGEVLVRVATETGVSAKQVRSDVQTVRRRWAHDDARRGDDRRLRILKGLERNARACRKAGDLAGERQALWMAGRLSGLGTLNVKVAASGTVRHEHTVAVEDRTKWLAEFVQAGAELGVLPVGMADAADPMALPPGRTQPEAVPA